jgi:PIN domain nuclease of toxin-antitoxin system
LRFLLDTHLLLWWVGESSSLSTAARQLIADPGNTIFISAVSLWEIHLKSSLGKLRLPADFGAKLSGEYFEDLPLVSAHTSRIASMPWHHRDPFDRMLIAQAQAEALKLLTPNRHLAVYGASVQIAL